MTRLAIPEGWRLVPAEPTPAMSAAGFCVSEFDHDPAGVYREMIAAAPQPAAQPQSEPCGGRDYCPRFPFCGCGRPDPLPERDQSKPDTEQGLFRKFDVKRTDGSDAPGGKHEGCEYFVLDVRCDPYAKAALAAHADACKSTHRALADDLRDRYDLSQSAPITVKESLPIEPTEARVEAAARRHERVHGVALVPRSR